MKEYLGDSVSVELTENGVLRLTTDAGWASQRIYLEPAVLAALLAYVATHVTARETV